ncbi:MAG: hypothetical protein ACE366_25460 [Bradymonadia bacterium]
MKRLGFSLTIVALAAMAMTTSAHAGRKKKKAKSAPAEIVVNNTCKEAVELSVAGTAIKVDGGATSAAVSVMAKADEPVQEVKVKDTLLARMVVKGEQKYTIKIANCQGGNADVFTQWTSAKASDSPHAMAQVRFRARARKIFEVMGGQKGRFKPLSVAVTKYQDAQPGEFPFGVRMRMARRGPIVANVKKNVALEAGRKYLIEVDAVGRDLFFSVEDEGLVE